MARKLSSLELCEKYSNETVHAEHVVMLALSLFDRTYRDMGLRRDDRRCLETACRLHNVGFSRDPEDYATASARIVMEEGLLGFTPAQRRFVAVAVLLHQDNHSKYLRDPLLERVRDHGRALRLAAYVRVADALDCAHIQDTRIQSVRLQDGRFLAKVACRTYEAGLAEAQRKSDLWFKVLRVPISFEPAPVSRKDLLFSDVVKREDSALSALRRLLCLQWRVIDENSRLIAEGGRDPEYLHDMRVAMNRFRMALRLFRGPLDGTSAAALYRRLGEFRQKVGLARDMQVWVAFLESRTVQRALRETPGWPEYLELKQKENETRRAGLRRVLKGKTYASLRTDMSVLARFELPRLVRASEVPSFRSFMARKIRRIYRRVLKEKASARKMSAEQMHRVRIRCRRARYWAEFGAPVLGASGRELAGRLKAVTGALGNLHDMDVHLEEADPQGGSRPQRLVEVMRRARRVSLRAFDKAWTDINDKAFRCRVIRTLKRYAGTR